MKTVFRTSLSLLALAVALTLNPVLAADAPQAAAAEAAAEILTAEVATTEGPVVGIIENNSKTQSYLGIPYAQPPVGALRWKAPADPAKRTALLKATKTPAKALQVSKGKIIGSDDCLYLNIWRPNSSAKKLPVMVFLHGGNNQTGASTDASHGAKLAAAQNMIVIGLNYRLGPLGFIRIPALQHGTPEENSGNYTLLDVEKALRWIQKNAASFGGDPKNVTLAGHSAGGRDVMAILTSPRFKGLFQKAMSFSGSQTISDPAWSRNIHVKAFVKLAVEDKKQPSEEEAAKWLNSDSPDVAEWLYSVDSARLVRLMSGAKIRMRVFPHLFADGTVLPKEGMKVYDSAKGVKNVIDVPLLLLGDASEFKFYCNNDPLFKPWIASGEVFKDPDKKAQYRYASTYGSLFFGFANTQNSAQRISQFAGSPIYVASFRWGDDPAVVGEEQAFIHGSKHGIHMDFIFDQKKFDIHKDNPKAYENAGADKLKVLTQSYIGNFVRTGNPNGANLPKWDAWSNKKGANTFLFLNADKDTASAKMTNWKLDADATLKQMKDDTTVSEEEKKVLLKKVLDGRFFSSPIDAYFGNPAHIMP